MNAKVSILIPLYNSVEYISDTLRSALDQTYQNTEIIVIDDGSTDGSLEAASKFQEDGVRIFTQTNQGASAARNHALRKSTGNLIQYLDGDDLLSPAKIENQVTILRKFPQCVVSCPWGKFARSIEETIFEPQRVWASLPAVEWLVTAWEGGGMMQTACWLTPREIIENSGLWNESLKHNPADDGEFFCRVLLQSKGVEFCNDGRVFYRASTNHTLSRQTCPEAVLSLYSNCELYELHLLKVEDTGRTRHACLMNYVNFIYRFHPEYPELIAKARNRIRQLGFKRMPPYGGKYFKCLSQFVGFENALRLRGALHGRNRAVRMK